MIKLKRILNEEHIKTVLYCDMDGVLTDFERRFKDVSGMSMDDYIKNHDTKSAWKLISDTNTDFASKMEWMPDGKELWSYLQQYNPIILTALWLDPSCEVGKKLWVQNNNITNKVIFTTSKDKYKYANKNSILIDDRKKNINDWINSGGIGVLHKNTKDTISQLNTILSESTYIGGVSKKSKVVLDKSKQMFGREIQINL